MSRLTRSAGLLVLVAALASGCGSDTGGDAGAAPGDGTSTSTASAELSPEPFCSQIDTTLVAAALGVDAGDVELVDEQEVGDKVDTGRKEGETVSTEANSCTLGTPTERFVVTVQPDSDAGDLTKLIKQFDARVEHGGAIEKCTKTEDASYGDPNAVVACEAKRGPTRVTVAALGLVGSSKFYCSSLLNDSSLASVEEPTLAACASVRDLLTAS